MIRRLAVALVAALPLAFSATAAAEVPPSPVSGPAPKPVPAGALAFPTPAPVQASMPTREAIEGLNWAGLGVRFGVLGLDVSTKDMDIFGDKVDEALDAYNRVQGSGVASRSDMDLDASLVQVIPTLHLGGDGFFFRLDVPIGFGDDITTIGLGLYPLAYGYFIESLGLFPYAAAGIGTHYATSGTVTKNGAKFDVSQSGAIVQGRLALGAKLRTFEKLNGVLEVGYSPFTAAVLWDSDKLDAIKNATLTSIPPDPAEAVRAGIGSTFDFSVGVEWL